jgi:pimeloyl-ACP methyl ester carboxylesterase
MGDYRVRQQMAACRDWPRGDSGWWRAGSAAPSGRAASRLPSSSASPATFAPLETPALVQVGEFDPATPLEQARAGMRLLPNGRLVVVPHGAHAFGGLGIDACINGMIVTFFEQGSATNLDTSCVAAARRPPFTVQ